MYRLIILLFVVVYVIYIVMVLCQCFGLFKITTRAIKLKALIPFYYWIKR